jgi:hypothetical protein
VSNRVLGSSQRLCRYVRSEGGSGQGLLPEGVHTMATCGISRFTKVEAGYPVSPQDLLCAGEEAGWRKGAWAVEVDVAPAVELGGHVARVGYGGR